MAQSQQPQSRQYNNTNRSDSEIIKTLLETNRQLTEQIIEMSRLIAGIQNPPLNIPMEVSNDPLNTPESEEDAQFLLRTGQIDKKQFEDILKELNFYNSEIIVPISE